MIWDRERYIAHSLFEDTGREMFCELFGPLKALEAEWRMQGASDKEIGMTAFDWDYVPVVGLAGRTGARTGIKPQILEDTPEIQLAIDGMGRHTKLIKTVRPLLSQWIIRLPHSTTGKRSSAGTPLRKIA